MYQNGVMPTNEWFEKIKAYVDFKDKRVIDFGCAEGIMARLIKESGASWVLGIDNQGNFQPNKDVEFIQDEITNHHWLSGDIGIFSMIIHWIGKEEFLKQIEAFNTLAVIFREENPGYQIPINGIWFPTLDELTKTLEGYNLAHNEPLMEQDHGKRIILAIYEKDRKKTKLGI